jgi:hypothetical protein
VQRKLWYRHCENFKASLDFGKRAGLTPKSLLSRSSRGGFGLFRRIFHEKAG